MIWTFLTRAVYDSARSRSDAVGNMVGFGIIINIAQIVGAIALTGNLAMSKEEVGIHIFMAIWIAFFISLVDYIYSCHKALSDKQDQRVSIDKSVYVKAKLLAKDKTLAPEWKMRARTVNQIAHDIKRKEKRYGTYPEITKVKTDIGGCIDSIIRFNMMQHGEHAEIKRREVDMVLQAYGELSA
jgi:hypothetical protein